MCPYTPPNSIFDGPITNVLSILCVLIELLSRAHMMGTKKKKNSLNGFNLALYCRLPSEGAASMTVNGLNMMHKVRSRFPKVDNDIE